MMNKLYITCIGILISCNIYSQSILKGKISDQNKEPLYGATIQIANTTIGTTSNEDGSFALEVNINPPYEVLISYVGFKSINQTITENNAIIDISMEEGVSFGEELVVTAAREPQKLTNAPATISRIGAAEIAQIAAPDPFELLATTKGVEYNRKGVGVVDFNIRGFNTSFNPRNLLMVDGRLTNLISIGLPYLQLTPVTKDDISDIEVVLGPSSALYGFGASNGLVNIITKDPREDPGTTVALGGGTQSQLSARFRHATRFNDKTGFKIAASYSQGTDFAYTDSSYYTISEALLPLAEQQGVAEYNLNPDFQIYKGDAALYTKIGKSTDLVFSAGYANGQFVQTTSIGRNQFRGWANYYAQIRMISPRWYVQVTRNLNKTTNDDSRVLSVLTDNIQSYQQFAAITGHPQLTPEFIDQQAQDFRLLNILPDGTLLELPVTGKYSDDSKRWNAEVQYNNRWDKLKLIGGMQFNHDEANSQGTFLIEETPGESINFTTFGGYVQLEYKFTEKLSLVGAVRGDHHSRWGFNVAPKAALVKVDKDGNGAWRLTYGRGIVAPTPLQAELTFAGGRLLGNSNGFTLLDVDYVNQTTSTREIAPLTVEKLDAFELGYKGKITDNFYIDANIFYNLHSDFITNAVTELSSAQATFAGDGVTPTSGVFVLERGGEPISNFQQPIFSTGIQLSGTPLAAFIDAGIIPSDASASTQTYFNFGKFQTYGFDIGLKYQFTPNLLGTLNYSLFEYTFDTSEPRNDLNGDGKVEEYVDIQVNSPNHKASLGLSYKKGNFFGNLTGRFVSSYNYFAGNTVAAETIPGLTYVGFPVIEGQQVNGSFNEGPLGGFVNFDINVGYTFLKNYTIIAGVTNLFDAKVRDFVTSPTIGRLFNFELKADF